MSAHLSLTVLVCMSLKIYRGFSDVYFLSVEMSCLHWTWFSPYSGFQVIYTDIGFHPKSGFKKKLSTHTIPLH